MNYLKLMLQKLREVQGESAAKFIENETIVETFDNDLEALKAARNGVALSDRTHGGILQLKGSDRLRFLHNQTTNDINSLNPGQGCDTVFVNSTGRTLDLTTVYATEDAILILVSPNRRHFLMEWMDRFIFPFDKVELSDISQEFAIFTLLGQKSKTLLNQLGINNITEQPEGNHAIVNLGQVSWRVAVGSGLKLPGYTLMIPIVHAAEVWRQLVTLGAIPMGDRVWEHLRIQQGKPLPDKELTEDYNPLEAGLWQAISFEKGCYIGQETIARLNTYQGVKQRLWGVKLNQSVEPGTAVTIEGNKVGILTSFTNLEGSPLGLAYIRTKAGGEGLKVQIGGSQGEIVSVPYLTHE